MAISEQQRHLNTVFTRAQPRSYWGTVEVVRVVQLTPLFRRITVTGPELSLFLEIHQPADAVKLFITDPPSPQAQSRTAPEVRPRPYTLINTDLAAGTADIDILDHGDGKGGNGPGAIWAHAAAPGWQVTIGGPRFGYAVPEDARAFRLFADLSALPAAAEIARAVGDRLEVLAVEIPDASEIRDLPGVPDTKINWLTERGPSGDALVDAAQELSWQVGDGVIAWAAGEADGIKRIRRQLRVTERLPRESVTVTGYWKRGADSPDQARMELAAELARNPNFDGNQYDLDSFEPEIDGK